MLDKEYDSLASLFCPSPTGAAFEREVVGGGGYRDLGGGTPGGALGGGWGVGGIDYRHRVWGQSGEFVEADGDFDEGIVQGLKSAGSSGTGLSLPPASLSEADFIQ